MAKLLLLSCDCVCFAFSSLVKCILWSSGEGFGSSKKFSQTKRQAEDIGGGGSVPESTSGITLCRITLVGRAYRAMGYGQFLSVAERHNVDSLENAGQCLVNWPSNAVSPEYFLQG